MTTTNDFFLMMTKIQKREEKNEGEKKGSDSRIEQTSLEQPSGADGKRRWRWGVEWSKFTLIEFYIFLRSQIHTERNRQERKKKTFREKEREKKKKSLELNAGKSS